MKNIKMLSLALTGITLLSAVPVNAYELENGDSIESVTYQNSEDEDFSNETSVLAEIGSQYKVTIPKFIVLSGKSKSANYKVSVEGDIAGTEDVIVTPDETVTLNSKNKDAQVASISQDKTSWHYDTFDVDANGSITANGITAGKWSGTFNFNINLDNSEKVTLAPGLYDENNNLIKSWDELTSLGLDVETDYGYSDYEKKPTSGYSVFKNNNLSGNLILPNTITRIGDSAFRMCKSLKSITIPDSVTSIDSYAFGNCESLESITIPDSVTSIADSAFYCASLKSITIPDSVTSIGDGTFYCCSSLESIIIPDSVTSIGNYAFNSCTSLKSVTIPDSVTSIGTGAFNYCTSLSITIPNSVTSIGNYAFGNVKHIYYNGSASGAPWNAKAIN